MAARESVSALAGDSWALGLAGDSWALGLWAALLFGAAVELLTPGTPLSAFLIIPLVASAALGRPALTASMTADLPSPHR